MVTVCNNNFETTEEYNLIFGNYPFELSNFQKHAIKNIREGNHVLITAHTGSGKTLPAEYSIEYFVGMGKKVVYTAPIKALSNQKFYELSRQYPNISFGLLTGDIKTNPEADVLIMTTEILRNTLFQKKLVNEQQKSITLNFDMDIDNELGCVIFDEIHYINDAERGKIWEETIMMLPKHVQMLMLSATLDKQENFAKWISEIKQSDVYITSTNERIVPLKHCSFVTCHSSMIKNMKDKKLVEKFNTIVNVPKLFKTSSDHEFKDGVYHSANELLNYIKVNKVFVKRTFVLNEAIKYLKNNNMLPAICFIFSRKAVEQCANEISVSLFDKDDTTPTTILNECQSIMMKIPNYHEYLNLPEYKNLLKILKKGIAIHHSGIMPVFREMIEIIFSKGYIKILFATETFAVGINMPTKTVMFTSLSKFDGSYNRDLLSHEYTQMAGRAGRRGIDSVGYVLHLNNLFNMPTITDYKFILSGKPQTLISKFKIHYNLILNLIQTSEENNDNIMATKLTSFVDKSMIQNEIMKEYDSTQKQYEAAQNYMEKYKLLLDECNTSVDVIKQYIDIHYKTLSSKNKIRKKYTNDMQTIKTNNKSIEEDIEIYKTYQNQIIAVEKYENTLFNIKNYTYETINMLIKILNENGFVTYDDKTIKLTGQGLNATQLQELHCLAFSELMHKTDFLKDYSIKQICALFSCFSNIKLGDEDKNHYSSIEDEQLKTLLAELESLYNKYFDIETSYQLDTGCDYNLTYDILVYIMEWIDADSELQCKLVLQSLSHHNMFLGEFIKALLKINNIATELEKVAEINNKIDLLQKLRCIPSKTLKFIATNQSLYV